MISMFKAMDPPPALPPRQVIVDEFTPPVSTKVIIDFNEIPPPIPARKGEPTERDEMRHRRCRFVSKELVQEVTFIINEIRERCTPLTLNDKSLVILSLYLPIYINSHREISTNLTMTIEYVPEKPLFYLRFPLMDDEAIRVEAEWSPITDV